MSQLNLKHPWLSLALTVLIVLSLNVFILEFFRR